MHNQAQANRVNNLHKQVYQLLELVHSKIQHNKPGKMLSPVRNPVPARLLHSIE
jgi:hypothetical protein